MSAEVGAQLWDTGIIPSPLFTNSTDNVLDGSTHDPSNRRKRTACSNQANGGEISSWDIKRTRSV